jgi:hypothetical protein
LGLYDFGLDVAAEPDKHLLPVGRAKKRVYIELGGYGVEVE